VETPRLRFDTRPGSEGSLPPALALTVVVPVFNQAGAIVENLGVIRDRIAAELDEPFELIVVSDGSIDQTGERLLELELDGVRVIHYDRNLGKGYAIKVGALEARGDWIAFCDADLDLDAGALAGFLETARAHDLDFAIGSKRHPESRVHYPRSRVVASWLFQQFVRVLFRLDVRDTQVGLKLFRHEIAEQVLPLLLVKRYAFDIELLAVSRAFGFSKIEELPITLEYRFTGSGVRSKAVLRALIDTAAIFYRLRVLRYYQRRRRLGGAYAWTRPRSRQPSVTVVTTDASPVEQHDYPNLDVTVVRELTAECIHDAVEAASGEVVAILEAGGHPSANWLSATAPFFARAEIAGVVTPRMAPHEGSVRQRAAAAIAESRVGAGSHFIGFTPGNVRYVDAFDATSLLVRRQSYLALGRAVPVERIASELAAAGERVLYTPETVVVTEPAPLFRPHLAGILATGRRRGQDVRRRGITALSRFSAVFLIGLAVFLLALPVALLDPSGTVARLLVVGCALYVIVLALSGLAAAVRFGSLRVGLVTTPGIALTHLTYAFAFVRGAVTGDEHPLP
jgi:glycosyltransferase involved in cell wall biosynthesis